jgi:DNA-binding transcriptional MerR regulator
VRALLPLGRFSLASRLSVRTLRRYETDGLLLPEKVDEETGQRLYDSEQLADARVIRSLRGLDVAPDRIRQVVTGRDTALLRQVVTDHHTRVRAEVVRRESIVTELDALLTGRGVDDRAVVRLKDLPAQQVVSTRVRTTLRGLPVVFAAAVGRLDRILRDAVGRRTGPTTVLHHGEEYDPKAVDVEIVVPIEGQVLPSRGIEVRTIEATLAAVTMHVGPYDSLDEGYRSVAVWVCENGYQLGNDPRETYLFGPDQAGPEQFRTEVSWPLTDL